MRVIHTKHIPLTNTIDFLTLSAHSRSCKGDFTKHMNMEMQVSQGFTLGLEYSDDSALRKKLGQHKVVKRVMQQRHCHLPG